MSHCLEKIKKFNMTVMSKLINHIILHTVLLKGANGELNSVLSLLHHIREIPP